MMLTPAAEPAAPFANGRASTSRQTLFRPETVVTDVEASLRYCSRQYLSAQQLAKPGFMTLCAVRHGGEIVDFEWDYVNTAAARMFLGTRDRMIGQRLLGSPRGCKQLSAVFAHYCRVAEGMASESLQHEHVGNDIDGVIRHVATRLGDGVAVTLSNLTAVTRADALHVQLVRQRERLQQQARDDSLVRPLVAVRASTPLPDPGVRTCDPDEVSVFPGIDPRVPQPPVHVIGQAMGWRIFSAWVVVALAKRRFIQLRATASRSFDAL